MFQQPEHTARPGPPSGDAEPGSGISNLGTGSAGSRTGQRGGASRAAPLPALEVEFASVTHPVVHDAMPGSGKAFASRNLTSAKDPNCDCARQEPCFFIFSYSSFLK